MTLEDMLDAAGQYTDGLRFHWIMVTIEDGVLDEN